MHCTCKILCYKLAVFITNLELWRTCSVSGTYTVQYYSHLIHILTLLKNPLLLCSSLYTFCKPSTICLWCVSDCNFPSATILSYNLSGPSAWLKSWLLILATIASPEPWREAKQQTSAKAAAKDLSKLSNLFWHRYVIADLILFIFERLCDVYARGWIEDL